MRKTVNENITYSCTEIYEIFILLQLGRCRFVGEFEKINRIGEGTYGIVCKFIILSFILNQNFEKCVTY